MAHIHSVTDTDIHYKIDGITRTVINVNETKKMLVQHDHNSERLTFELPRYIDNHDITECNVVQVHFTNADTYEKNFSRGIYDVDDLGIKGESGGDENVAILTWLVSGDATKYVGSLSFVIRFSCVTDGVIDYAWNTSVFKGMTILEGIYNSDSVVKEHIDAFEQIKSQINEDTREYAEDYISETFEQAKAAGELTGPQGPQGVPGASALRYIVEIPATDSVNKEDWLQASSEATEHYNQQALHDAPNGSVVLQACTDPSVFTNHGLKIEYEEQLQGWVLWIDSLPETACTLTLAFIPCDNETEPSVLPALGVDEMARRLIRGNMAAVAQNYERIVELQQFTKVTEIESPDDIKADSPDGLYIKEGGTSAPSGGTIIHYYDSLEAAEAANLPDGSFYAVPSNDVGVRIVELTTPDIANGVQLNDSDNIHLTDAFLSNKPFMIRADILGFVGATFIPMIAETKIEGIPLRLIVASIGVTTLEFDDLAKMGTWSVQVNYNG